jgi:hypothetical protein
MTDSHATIKGVLWNAAAFTVSYSLLNYLIPNECITYFTKSFFATSGILVSGILNSYVYTKVSGKTIWVGDTTKESSVVSSEITVILNENEESDVDYPFTIGNYLVSLVYDDIAELISLSVSKNDLKNFETSLNRLGPDSRSSKLELSWRDGKLFIQSPVLTVVKVNIVNLSG